MADTIVTLSGDDAQLYKAFQRILDQQAKAEGGYSELAKKSKQAAKEAADAAKKQAEEEKQAAKEAADAAKQAAKEKADAEKEAAREQKAAMRDAEREAKRIAREEERDAENRRRVVMSGVTAVTSLAASYVSVSTAINAASAAASILLDNQKQSLEAVNAFAAAQENAAKNMAGQSAAAIGATLSSDVPKLAADVKFPDLPKLTDALGAVVSIIGDKDKSMDIARTSAQLTRLNPGQLQETATGTADLAKATGLGGREALSMLASTGSVARPEQLAKLATGGAIVANAAIMAAPGEDKVASTKEGLALYAGLSSVDPQGQSSATAAAQAINQIKELFTDQKSKVERDDKIAKLASSIPETEIAIKRAELSVDQASKKAATLKPSDESLRARDLRLDLLKAQDDLRQRNEQLTKSRDELAKLQALNQATQADPVALTGRLSALRSSPALQTEFINNLRGEEKYKPLFTALLDPNSEFSKQFETALGSITTNVDALDTVLKSVVETPQAKIASADVNVKSQIAVAEATDTYGAAREFTTQSVNAVLKRTANDGRTAMGAAFSEYLNEPFNTVMSNAEGAMLESERILMDRLDYMARWTRKPSPENAEALAGVFEEVIAMAKSPAVIDQLKREGSNVEKYLEKQDALLTELIETMRELRARDYAPQVWRAREQVGQETGG